MTQLRFALAQIDTCVGGLQANASLILQYCRMAAAHGAGVVVCPEMTLTGYPIEDLALRATFRKAASDEVGRLARTLEREGLGDLYVVVGTVGTVRPDGSVDDDADDADDERGGEGDENLETRDSYADETWTKAGPEHNNPIEGNPTNRLVVLHDGEQYAAYDKHFLPNYGVFDEFRIFQAGDAAMIFNAGGVHIGVAICEDIWQDGGPVEALAQRGIDVLLTINGSPYEEGKTHTRYDLAAQRASEVNAPVIYVNQVGGQDDLVFDGGSFVLDADGTTLERSPMFMEDLSYFDFDTDAAKQQVGTLAAWPGPDEEVYTACVLGLKDYMAKNHFDGVTLGLSGGIDSALVAAMAADACGGQNVWGISMPSMYSSDGSKDDASDLAHRIGAHYDVQPIEPLFKAFQGQLNLEGVAAENLQARIRGVIVMAYSNSKGLLALATGNKSELACGYSTIYGDAVGGYAPIKDLLKTRVWELARWRNSAASSGMGVGGLHIVGNEGGGRGMPQPGGVMIPVSSIEKAPSAELRPGQKDSDSLPEYAMLDKVLAAYIEKAHGRADLLADGFDETTVDTVMRLVDRAEWKRRQYPLGPKVTALAFGRDRRLPVTSAFRE